MAHSAPTSQFTVPRIALAAAAFVALTTVGVSIWKQQVGDAPAATVAGQKTDDAPDVGTMIAGLEKKLKENPGDDTGWRMLGWAFFESGKYAESATAYARATQINPAKAEYWSSLGEARVLAGSGNVPADAKSAFERAVTIDPKDPRARYFLGVARDIAGDHSGAVDDWFALLGDTPPGAPWEADLRRIINDVGAREKIDVASRFARLRTAPTSPGANTATAAIPGPSPAEMRSAAALPKGQQDAMVQTMVDGLDAKLKTNPKNESGWIMLMRSRIQLGQSGKANAAYQNALGAFATDPGALDRIKDAASELGIAG